MSDVVEQRRDSDQAGNEPAESMGNETTRPSASGGPPARPDLPMAPPARPDLPMAPPPRPSVSPRATPRESMDTPRPRVVDASYWMWVFASLAAVVTAALTLLDWDALHDRMAARTRTEFPDETQATIDEVATAALAIFIGFAVVLALLMLAFATMMRNQRSWARVVLVIVGLVVIFYGVLMAAELETAAQTGVLLTGVLVAAAAISMWISPAGEWFDERRSAAKGYDTDFV